MVQCSSRPEPPVPSPQPRGALDPGPIPHCGMAERTTGAVAARHDYDPFGVEMTAWNDGETHKFTGLERDAESSLDYALFRMYASQYHRWLTPDPVAGDVMNPQSLNRYAYVRNNPTTLVDPEGESIELICRCSDAQECARERQKELQALQEAVGEEAGSYLYENPVTTTDANGNPTTRYYVGIYSGGPSGSGPAFEQINSVAGELAPIINDSKNVQLAIAPSGAKLTDDLGYSVTLSGRNPGVTGIFGGNLRTYLVDPSTPLQPLPGIMMSNGQPGVVTPGIVVGHELGHARGVMTGALPGATDHSWRRIENKVRTRDNPNVPQRMIHDCPPVVCP
jgi:RHS repeat-associated protein